MGFSRKQKYMSAFLPIVSTFIFIIALNIWVIDHPYRIDVTAEHVYSPDEKSVAILDAIKDPITITFFHDTRNRVMQDAKYLLSQYGELSPLIKFQAHDPTLEPAIAEKYQIKFSGVTVFETKDRKVLVNQPNETEFLNAIIRLSSDAVGTVCFTDGHVESNPLSLQAHDHYENQAQGHDHAGGGKALLLHERHGMGMARNALEVLGYRVEQRLLTRDANSLDGCSLVIVASPQTNFSKKELSQLENFSEKGGTTLLLLEPGIVSGLESMLTRHGVSISNSRVIDPKRYYWTDTATPAISDYERHRITRRLPMIFFPGAAELSPISKDEHATSSTTPLFFTSNEAVLDSDSSSEGERRALAVLISSKDGHGDLIVVGDGDFATNSFYGAVGNGQFFLNTVSELLQHQNLIDLSPRNYHVATMNLSNNQMQIVFFLTTLLGPLLLLLAGLFVWRSRR
jgi:hypothetical protein